MVFCSFSVIISIVLIISHGLTAAYEPDDLKIKPADVLPSIVTKIVRRGLVPKRSRLVGTSTSTTETPDDPPIMTLNQEAVETHPKNVSELSNRRVNDDKSLDQMRNLQCSTKNEGDSTTLIAYDEFKCKNSNNNGEYLHNIELIDGTRHKEEGIVINGRFTIRGYFFSKDDPKYFHIYIKDETGFHYYLVPVSNADGTQEYGIGDEDDEICSVRGDSCIDPKILASMLG